MLNIHRVETIIRLTKLAFGAYKLQVVILVLLGFLGGVLEGIGVNALIPLFSFFVKSGNREKDAISQAIEKFFAYFDISFSLKYLLIFISLLFIVRAIVLILCSYINVRIGTHYEEQMRNRVLNKTLKASWPYLLKQKVGHLETVLLTDVQCGAAMLQQISSIIIMLTGFIIYILVAFNISVYITLITIVLGAVLFLLLKPLIHKTRIVAHTTEEINRQIAHYVNENIIGIKTIKAMAVVDRVIKIGEEYFNKLKKIKIKIYLLKSVSGSLLQPISLVFICAVFAFSYKTPNFSFAALVAVIYLIQRIFQYIQQSQNTLHVINEYIPYLRTALSYEEEAVRNQEKEDGREEFKFNDVLEFKNVNFIYDTEREVLSDVDFVIKKGEMVGLIGPSGAGKTTIVDLVLRLLVPTGGKIFIDDQNIADINLEKWRKSIGYVSQDMFLMNDTIANNVRFYDSSITDEEMRRAAETADILDFVKTCPNGFDEMVGERGLMLSAGQRQRVIIARVLARQPKFLILDEATSALDNESEYKIQQIIKNLKGKVTVLAVAHRLSTLRNADRLLILNKGKIVEEGQPEELLKDKDSYFFKMYNLK